MDYYSLKWILLIFLPEVIQCFVGILSGPFRQLTDGKETNDIGKVWLGPAMIPPFCFEPWMIPGPAPIPVAEPLAPALASASVQAPKQSFSPIYPESVTTSWWCPSIYQKSQPQYSIPSAVIYPQVPQNPQALYYPQGPYYPQIPYYPQTPHYPPIPHYPQVSQYPQNPYNFYIPQQNGEFTGSSLHEMTAKDSEPAIKKFDPIQANFT
ncbi:unnamed protein product [Onchocerca ochengi]|uniref:Leucine-rich repeat extensin-like protein 5 n=1 Tax=Onchocerca ochengi TaxID=42157 RepID=A0A182E1B5_ONCOC|nr:unnamed protein product [Onchocerca ochengi]